MAKKRSSIKNYLKSLNGLTGRQFINYFANRNNIPKTEARLRVEEFTSTLIDAVHNFGGVKIDNFGKFEIQITRGTKVGTYGFDFEGKKSYFEVVPDLAPYFKYFKNPPKILDLDIVDDDSVL